MSAKVIQPRAFREERNVDPRPSGPFAQIKGAAGPSAYERHLLGCLADLAIDVAASLDAMSTLHAVLQVKSPLRGANRAAAAKPHIDALIQELISIEEAYGLELTAPIKRGDAKSGDTTPPT